MWETRGKAGGKKPERSVLAAAGVAAAFLMAVLLMSRTDVLAGTRALVGGLRAPAPSQFPCDESSPVGSTPLECAMDKLQRTQEQLDEARAEAARLKAAAAGQQQEQPPAAKQQEQGAAAEQDASRWEGWEAELKLGEGEARKEAQATAEAELAEWEEDWEEEDAESADQEAQAEEEEQQAVGKAGGKEEDEEDEEGEEEAQSSGQGPSGSGPTPYQQALAQCNDLACLTAAAAAERVPGQYRFPHFYIVGWQKCATTSLYHHLKDHPTVLASKDKEPEFFSNECGYDPAACPPAKTEEYIWKTMRLGEALAKGLRKGAVEASTHYGRNGHILASKLRQVFPWLKVVMSMREPISRGISMLAHNLDKHDYGCLASKQGDVYGCLLQDLSRENYSYPLQSWLEAYPREQLFLVQYENITSSATMPDVLHDVKRFLKIDPELPHSDLGIRNTRELHLQRKGQLEEGEEADGWPMQRWQYEALVKLVRPDAQKVADIATEYGLADGKQWMRNWETEWQATLDECNPDGSCIVNPN